LVNVAAKTNDENQQKQMFIHFYILSNKNNRKIKIKISSTTAKKNLL